MASTAYQKLLAKCDKNEYLDVGWDHQWDWCVSTGVPQIDYICGRDVDGYPGIPGGVVVSIEGEPKEGKSSIAFSIIAEAQKEDILGRRPPILCCLFDYEGGLTQRSWFKAHNIDLSTLRTKCPDTLEEGLDISWQIMEDSWTEHLKNVEKAEASKKTVKVEPPVPGLFVFDTASQAPTETESDLSISDQERMAATASVLSRAFRRMTPLIRKTKSIFLVLNQHRAADVGDPNAQKYKKKTFRGQRPVDFASGLSLVVRRKAHLTDKLDRRVGMVMKVWTKFNKVAIGGAVGGLADDVTLSFKNGFNKEFSLHNLLLTMELSKRKGTKSPSYIVDTPQGEVRYVGKQGIAKLSDEDRAKLESCLIIKPELPEDE